MRVESLEFECEGRFRVHQFHTGTAINGLEIGVLTGGDGVKQGLVRSRFDETGLIVRQSFRETADISGQRGFIAIG